ncbi:MAG: ABC transporter ATP-binding protein [Planctomycetota bacterium]|nr:MAG: ABC transporter ATP-binding protein [Planctomycetota bacterium]
MISVQELVRRYGAFTAVDGISFEVGRGEVVGFLGINGAGKTTTLRILTGYMPATSGTVRVAGFDLARQSLEARQRIGYLPEGVPLYRDLRLSEMLEFQGRLHGLDRARIARRVPEVLAEVGLGERARSLLGDFSKGMRQRAGLAVALLSEPEVLVLDEPTSGLDPLQRAEVRELVRKVGRERTVIFSSHILSEVEAVAERVIVLHRGRIAADGKPAELARTLGGASHVRCEAVVGADVEAALRLLRALPGALRVAHGGRLGIHHVFRIECAEDLREDVGALAAQRGWALRELSFQRPTLEQLFARIALELPQSAAGVEAPPASASANEEPTSGLVMLGASSAAPAARAAPAAPSAASAASASAAPAAPAEKPRVVYNLNPFDQGWKRDLGAPKAVEPPDSVPPS